MDMIPVKKIEWEVHPDTGLVNLKRPKFRASLLKKYLLPLFSDPYFRIKLDEIGTFVWREIDGHKNVATIAAALEKTFGARVNPVHERLGKFIIALKRSRFIDYRKLSG